MSWVSVVWLLVTRYKPGDVERVTIFLDFSFLVCKMNASDPVVSKLPSQPQLDNLNRINAYTSTWEGRVEIRKVKGMRESKGRGRYGDKRGERRQRRVNKSDTCC